MAREANRLRSDIVDYVNSLPGFYVFCYEIPNRRGYFKSERLFPTGNPDIIGLYQGQFIGIEVKSKTDTLRQHQKEQLDTLWFFKAKILVASSVSDVAEWCENLMREE